MIIINSNSFNYEIDEYKLNMYENVEKYNYVHCIPELQLELSDIILNNDKQYYYIFDCPGGDAFAHWIYESFIFIPIFMKVKLIYQNIKILTKNSKKYVKNFFEFYKITNEIVNKIDNINNICFFSPIIALNDHNINKDFFIKHIDLFCDYINKNINIYKKENILFLPRNTKDNYANNDRTNSGNNDICSNIEIMKETIIDTYELNNIELQFSKINSFNTIILDFGSSFFVNGIFIENKKIIVLDYCCMSSGQINNYTSYNILHNYISSKNNVIIIKSTIPNTINFNDIQKYL
jgi:hypothetical protein